MPDPSAGHSQSGIGPFSPEATPGGALLDSLRRANGEPQEAHKSTARAHAEAVAS
jgi:hypothetical protein